MVTERDGERDIQPLSVICECSSYKTALLHPTHRYRGLLNRDFDAVPFKPLFESARMQL